MMGIGREEMGVFIELDSSVVERNRHWSDKIEEVTNVCLTIATVVRGSG